MDGRCLSVEVAVRGHAFINTIQGTSRFSSLSGDSQPVELADDGWPVEDFKVIVCDYRPPDEWRGDDAIDDPDRVRCDISGIYSLSFCGSAVVLPEPGFESTCSVEDLAYDPITNITTGKVIVNASVSNHGLVFLRFIQTSRRLSCPDSGGVTDIKLLTPGYFDPARQVFTTELLKALRPFEIIRFMDVLETNNKVSYEVDGLPCWLDWSERILPDQALHPGPSVEKTRQGDAGWAWENIIELANESGCHPYINIPVAASDDYVLQLGKLLSSGLRSDLVLYVEFSNEIWNGGFSQSRWIQDMAQRILEFNPGHPINYDGKAIRDPICARQRYGLYRSMQLVNLLARSFGPKTINNRIRFLVSYDATDDALLMIRKMVGPPSEYFWAHAVTGYFGMPDEMPENMSIDAILDEMEQAVDELNYQYHVDRSMKWGLKTVVYEGGPNTSPGLGELKSNVASVIRASRTDRMGELIIKNLEKADRAGIEWFNHFTLSSHYSRWGTWGLSDDIRSIGTSPKYQAILQYLRNEN